MPEMKSVAPTIVGKHNTSRRCICTQLAIHSRVSFLTGLNDIVPFDKEIPVFCQTNNHFKCFLRQVVDASTVRPDKTKFI